MAMRDVDFGRYGRCELVKESKWEGERERKLEGGHGDGDEGWGWNLGMATIRGQRTAFLIPPAL
jgi:hypothetical protein